MTPRRAFDFTINIPTIIIFLGAVVSASGAFMHLSDNQARFEQAFQQQAKLNLSLNEHIEQQDRLLAIWEERMKDFPLHRHVEHAILYPAGPNEPSPEAPSKSKGQDP